MRISDWSSDLCSSDLAGDADQRIAGGADLVAIIGKGAVGHPFEVRRNVQRVAAQADFGAIDVLRDDRQAIVAELRIVAEAEVAVGIDLAQLQPFGRLKLQRRFDAYIGRASCRERAWQYV